MMLDLPESVEIWYDTSNMIYCRTHIWNFFQGVLIIGSPAKRIQWKKGVVDALRRVIEIDSGENNLCNLPNCPKVIQDELCFCCSILYNLPIIGYRDIAFAQLITVYKGPATQFEKTTKNQTGGSIWGDSLFCQNIPEKEVPQNAQNRCLGNVQIETVWDETVCLTPTPIS